MATSQYLAPTAPNTPSEAAIGILTEPLLRHLTAHAGNTARAYLDQHHPRTVVDLLEQGAMSLKASCGHLLSAPTVNAIDQWVSLARSAAAQGEGLWGQLDSYVRRGAVDQFMTGATADEAQMGAAVGSLFGPIGLFVGAALGGLAAGQRVEDQARRAAAEFDAWRNRWTGAVDAFFDQHVRPALVRDLDAPPPVGALPGSYAAPTSRRGVVMVLVVAGAALASVATWWFTREPSGHANTSSALPASVGAVTAAGTTRASLGPIVGLWTTPAGDAVRAAESGDGRVSLTISKAAAGSASRVGDVLVRLAPTNAATFDAEVLVRPGFPVGIKLSDAALHACEESWTELHGARLQARLDGDRLVVDSVKLALDARGLEIAGGRVVGCKKFDDSKAVRAPLVLVRSPAPGGR